MVASVSAFFLAAVLFVIPAGLLPQEQQTFQEKETKKGQEEKPAPGKPAKQPAADDPDEAVIELEKAVERASNDRAALVRELEAYLKKFPDAPRKVQVYRALVEAAMQLRDSEKAIEYAERVIALRPDDTSMMLVAVDLLERKGDEKSLVRAAGYAARVIDIVEKTPTGERSPRVSEAEWLLERNKMRMSLYLMSGRLEMQARNYDAAAIDLRRSYEILPNAQAAMRLGEIAEIRKEYAAAIEHYVNAFVLAEEMDTGVDRRELRRKLGNLWKIVNGSEAGLGERLLAAYDAMEANGETKKVSPNRGVEEVWGFVLRRPEGGTLRLSEKKGKVLVLNFWATWCGPCREMEPLFEQVMRKYEGTEVTFLAVSGDEDETRVLPYMEREKVKATVAFDDGLAAFLGVQAYPTVIILDREGKVAYSARGFDAEGFVERLAGAIERAMKSSSSGL